MKDTDKGALTRNIGLNLARIPGDQMKMLLEMTLGNKEKTMVHTKQGRNARMPELSRQTIENKRIKAPKSWAVTLALSISTHSHVSTYSMKVWMTRQEGLEYISFPRPLGKRQ